MSPLLVWKLQIRLDRALPCRPEDKIERMFRVAVSVFLALVVGEFITMTTADDFTCYPNNTVHYSNPLPSTYTSYRAFYGSTNCTFLTSLNSNADVYFDCDGTSSNITIYFSDRSLSDDDIIGGLGVMYSFQCDSLSDFNETLTNDLTDVSVNHTVESSDPIYNITSDFFDSSNTVVTTATVGQDLTFTITGPIDFQLLPMLCVAQAGTGASAVSKTVITDGCSDDTNLVSNFAESNNTNTADYDMTFHAFKFYDHDDLTLVCTVKVCIADSGCGMSCSTGRKRRAIPGPDEDIKTTTIGKRLIIKDAVLGGSANINGSLGLTSTMALLFLVMKS